MRRTLSELVTIRVRLIFWYVFFLAVTILGFSAYLQVELQHSLSTQLDAGMQVAASQLLVDVDDTVNPPMLRPMSQTTVDYLHQSQFALRLVTDEGEVTAGVGLFPDAVALLVEGYETVMDDGTHWRIYTQRVVTNAGEFDVFLQMAQSLDTIDSAQNSLLHLILIGLPVVLLTAALVGVFIANRSLHPLNAMTRTAQQINATDMTRRIDHSGPSDELGRLASTVNSMLDRLESAFETERRFTADASHELRTPLTAIKGQIGVTLSRPRNPEEYQTTLMHIQHETDRLIRMTNDLLFLARLDRASSNHHDEPLNLSDLLGAVVDQMMPVAQAKKLHIECMLPEHISMIGLPDHLIRLFLNLIDNAIKFTPPEGHIKLTCKQTEREVQISISDSGPGIAPEHLSRIFQRFYRVEADRSARVGGTGLGLAIAYQIARAHRGQIAVESNPGEGATFTVILPMAEPSYA